MSYYGARVTWKIIYYPKVAQAGVRGVALVEADSHQQAMYTFSQEYAGQYTTIESCRKLLG